jgi:hypothetical protein
LEVRLPVTLDHRAGRGRGQEALGVQRVRDKYRDRVRLVARLPVERPAIKTGYDPAPLVMLIVEESFGTRLDRVSCIAH